MSSESCGLKSLAGRVAAYVLASALVAFAAAADPDLLGLARLGQALQSFDLGAQNLVDRRS